MKKKFPKFLSIFENTISLKNGAKMVHKNTWLAWQCGALITKHGNYVWEL